jgi:hypothetical protein
VWEDSTFGESTGDVQPVTDPLGASSVPSAPALRKIAEPNLPDTLPAERALEPAPPSETATEGATAEPDGKSPNEVPASQELDAFFFED